MKSTLKFYKIPFTEEENKLIEDMASFLERTAGDNVESQHATFLGEISGFQFQKHDLELEIKIVDTELATPLLDANYVSIRNIEENSNPIGKMFFYFIKSITAVSESCLKLSLRMDTLNCYGSEIIKEEYWLPSTLVEREHKDRFFTDPNGAFTHTIASNKYAKKVDNVPEGINFPMRRIYKNTIDDILSSKFYLVYRSSFDYNGDINDAEQSANAIKCFLVAEKGKQIPMMNYQGNATDVDLTLDILDEIPNVGDTIIFDSDDNPDMWYEKFYYDGGKKYNGTSLKFAKQAGMNGLIGIHRYSATGIKIFSILYNDTSYTSFGSGTTQVGGCLTSSLYHANDSEMRELYKTITTENKHRISGVKDLSYSQIFNNCRIAYRFPVGSAVSQGIPTQLSSWSTWLNTKQDSAQIIYALNRGVVNMKTIDQVDRTDSRLIKIVELPYAPNTPVANHYGTTLFYTFGDNWSSSADYDEKDMDMANAFQLVGDIEPDFTHTLSEKYTINGVASIGGTMLRPWTINLETKMKHSDFEKKYIVYDNFSTEIKEELLFNRTNYWVDDQLRPANDYLSFDVIYTASSNLASGNLFALECWFDGDNIVEEYYDSDEIYPLKLIAIRNNEINLYNASYLNYIRAGYNYDVKAKSIAQKQGILSATQGMVNGLIGATNHVAQGNPSGVVHTLTGIFGAVYNYNVAIQQVAFQQQLAQNQIDKSLHQSALQGTSVAGADNLSLFNKYSQNKLFDVRMKILPIYEEKVATLLHYFGYASDRYKIPAFTGRCFFNYVKCQASLKDFPVMDAVTNLQPLTRRRGGNEELLEVVLEKFQQGVFIIHKFAPNTIIGNETTTWNISMDKENWENFILEDLQN